MSHPGIGKDESPFGVKTHREFYSNFMSNYTFFWNNRTPFSNWGIRVFVNDEINQESTVEDRTLIGPEIRSMLRMEDKCGNISGLAHNSRFRPGRKENARREQQ